MPCCYLLPQFSHPLTVAVPKAQDLTPRAECSRLPALLT